jgi:hypothetical protein
MERGNLSNNVRPRVILVFEGALGHISGTAVEEFNDRAAEGLWVTAWDQWTLNDLMSRKIWDVVKRLAIQVSVATLLVPDEFSDVAGSGLQDVLDIAGLPVSEIIVMSAERLSRELPFMPDVARVYDANPETAGMFGRKGVLLRNVNDFGQL